MGSLTRVLYLVIDSPVTGCITGAQKCSQSHGIACDVGNGAYVWMLIAESAALLYCRGVMRAMRGDLRGPVALSAGGINGLGGAVGSMVGAGSCIVVIGVGMGGTLLRVLR